MKTVVIKEMDEIDPALAYRIKKIWDDCGTHVTSREADIGAKEIEFFVEQLMKQLVEDLEIVGVDGVKETLKMVGYLE